MKFFVYFFMIAQAINSTVFIRYNSICSVPKNLVEGVISFNKNVNPVFISNYYNNAIKNIKSDGKTYMLVIADSKREPIASMLLTEQNNGYIRQSLIGLDQPLSDNKEEQIKQMSEYFLTLKEEIYPNKDFCAFFPAEHLEFHKGLLEATSFKEDPQAKCSEEELNAFYGDRNFDGYLWYSDKVNKE